MATTRDVLEAIHFRRTNTPGSDLFATIDSYAQTAAEIAAGVTPVNYSYAPMELGPRYGIVADGITDNTAMMLAVANAFTAGGLFTVPYGVKYNRSTLIASLHTNIVLFDLSLINDYSSAGETNKHVGITSSDNAVNDTHWHINSGHHAVMDLNNFGTAGSTSATNRLMSIIFNSGQFALGGATKQGYRPGAINQWAKSPSGNFWIWHLRSFAPWVSVAGNYENWAQGQVIAGAGVYRASSVGHYISTGAGTTGSTEPVHTSGTVSDGGVSWTYVDSIDRTVFSTDEYGRWLTGSGSGANTWEHKVGSTDPNGNYVMRLVSRGVSKTADHILVPTDGSNTETAVPFIRADATVGRRIMKSDASTDLARYTDTGYAVKKLQLLSVTATNNSTTPSTTGASTLFLTNSSATSITTLTGAVDDDIVVLIATNANTTLVSSATFLLTGSANIALTAYSSVTMKKVPVSISDRWVEIARSIK